MISFQFDRPLNPWHLWNHDYISTGFIFKFNRKKDAALRKSAGNICILQINFNVWELTTALSPRFL